MTVPEVTFMVNKNPKRLNQSRETEICQTIEITCCLRAMFNVRSIVTATAFQAQQKSHHGSLLPPVAQNPIVQKSLEPILWSRKYPSSSTLMFRVTRVYVYQCFSSNGVKVYRSLGQFIGV